LQQLGCPSGRANAQDCFPDGERAYCVLYIQLRRLVRAHMASRQAPMLRECKKPTQAWNWQPATEIPDDIGGIDILHEGEEEQGQTEELSTPV